jgi:hypothetical protein
VTGDRRNILGWDGEVNTAIVEENTWSRASSLQEMNQFFIHKIYNALLGDS